jgi:hypothetical protein
MMANEPLITIGYSTLAERAKNIQPPELDIPHSIYISIQNPQKVEFSMPQGFSCDHSIAEVKGVAKSRNVVLDATTTDFLLFADDEIRFIPESIKSALEYFHQHPECDLILAQTIDTDGNLRKSYPRSETALTRFNSAKAATYEMVIRTSSIRNKGIRFDENFGAGAENYLGDEYIFITDLLKKGGKAVFLPITLAIHPVESSGSGWGSQRDLRARAAIFSRIFGAAAPIIRAAFFIKNYSKMSGLRNFFTFTFNK